VGNGDEVIERHDFIGFHLSFPALHCPLRVAQRPFPIFPFACRFILPVPAHGSAISAGALSPRSASFSRRVFGKPSNHFSARRGRGASQKNGEVARDAKHPVWSLGGCLASCAQRLSTLQPGSSLQATKRGGITSPKRGQGWLAVNYPAAGASMKSGAWRPSPSVAERQFPPRSSSRNPPPKMFRG
jgi:hypothetical protein